MAIVHAARGNVITSVQLETAGVNIPFLHTRLSSNQDIFKTQYYSSAALKPPRASEKQDRRTARNGAGEKIGVRQPGKRKGKRNTSGGKLDCKIL